MASRRKLTAAGLSHLYCIYAGSSLQFSSLKICAQIMWIQNTVIVVDRYIPPVKAGSSVDISRAIWTDYADELYHRAARKACNLWADAATRWSHFSIGQWYCFEEGLTQLAALLGLNLEEHCLTLHWAEMVYYPVRSRRPGTRGETTNKWCLKFRGAESADLVPRCKAALFGEADVGWDEQMPRANEGRKPRLTIK